MSTPDAEERYRHLLAVLAAGMRLPYTEIQRRCEAAGHGPDDVLYHLHSTECALQPVSGDPCPECDGVIHVRSSKRIGQWQVRRLRCNHCGYRPEIDKQPIPAEAVRRRRRVL